MVVKFISEMTGLTVVLVEVREIQSKKDCKRNLKLPSRKRFNAGLSTIHLKPYSDQDCGR